MEKKEEENIVRIPGIFFIGTDRNDIFLIVDVKLNLSRYYDGRRQK